MVIGSRVAVIGNSEEGKEERLDRLRRRLLAATPQKKQSSSEDESSDADEASSDEDSSSEESSEESNTKKKSGTGATKVKAATTTSTSDSDNDNDDSTEDPSSSTSATTTTSTSEEKSKAKPQTNKNKSNFRSYRKPNRAGGITLPTLDQYDEQSQCSTVIDVSKDGLTLNLSQPASTSNSTNVSARDGKKRRRRRPMTICLTHCRYELVRSLAHRFGLIDVNEDTAWNIYWTDYSVSLERAVDMRRFQIVNHFPGMNEICRKDLLARNLNRMKRVFPEDYNIYPMTWCLPADNNELQAYSTSRRGKTYICKPEMGCQGRGIFLVKNIKDLNPFGRIICQIYIQKPFLIDHLKFDLRIYVLITCCDPLRVWVYKEGLARFATAKYRQPTQNNTENSYMHLTNYAVNKFSRDFVVDGDTGTKRKLTTVYQWLSDRDHDVDQLEQEIDDVILKTILSAQPILRHHYRTCFPHHDICSACFEILGFDILIDHKLKPYVIEVNHSPSFHTDTPLDQEIKSALLNDTFAMLHFKQLDRVRIEREDRRRVQERLSSKLQEVKNLMEGKKAENNPTSNRKRAQQMQAKKAELEKEAEAEKDKPNRPDSARKAAYIEAQFKWEMEHKGGYRLIYPLDDSAKYDKFLAQNQVSLYQETAASQARANLTRVQMDEYNLKKQLDEQKRCGGAQAKDGGKVRPESASSNPETKKKSRVIRKNTHTSVLPVNASGSLKTFNLCHIVAEEDCERVRALIQRGLLIRSLGIELQAYRLLCKVGSLKKPDHEEFRRKHGFVLTNYQAAQALILARKDSFVYPSNASSSNPSRAEIEKYQGETLFDPALSQSRSVTPITSSPMGSSSSSPYTHKSSDAKNTTGTRGNDSNDKKFSSTSGKNRLENPGHQEEYFQAKMAQMDPPKPQTQVQPMTSSTLFTMRWAAGAAGAGNKAEYSHQVPNHTITMTHGDYFAPARNGLPISAFSSNTNTGSRELPTGAAQIKAIAKTGPIIGGIPLQNVEVQPPFMGRLPASENRYDFPGRKTKEKTTFDQNMRRWGTPTAVPVDAAFNNLKANQWAVGGNGKPPVIPRFQYSQTMDGQPQSSLGRLLPSTQSQLQMPPSQSQAGMAQRRTMTPGLESAAVIFPRRGNNKISFSNRVPEFSKGDLSRDPHPHSLASQITSVRRLDSNKSPPTSMSMNSGQKKDGHANVVTFENAPLFLKGFNIQSGGAPTAFKL